MYEGPALKTGRRPATFLLPAEWPAAGQWLEESIGLRPAELLERLADLDTTSSSNRLRSYFTGERLPESATLEAICEAGEVSYFEAVDRFGYYREIVKFFDDLVWLGDRWLNEDNARGGTLGANGEELSGVESLRSTGVLFWNDEPITWGRRMPGRDKPGLDPSDIPAFTDRYVIGAWREIEHRNVSVELPRIEAVPGETFSLTSPLRLEHVDASLRRESLIVPEHTVTIVVPKPVGVAIVLATLAFPLRGDGYKDGAMEYRFNLSKAADPMLRDARRLRANVRAIGRPKRLHPLLQRCCDALDDRSVPFNYRRPMAGEYIVMWATAICSDFTHFARLAGFDFWGEAGGHSWAKTIVPQYGPHGFSRQVEMPRPSAFAMMPQARLADLPDIEILTTYH